ncbi:MAG: hypothetical protein IPK39_01290 [Sulfuritalea sp.]|nr:hypothetical protein [Sulfuritalea sp.]
MTDQGRAQGLLNLWGFEAQGVGVERIENVDQQRSQLLQVLVARQHVRPVCSLTRHGLGSRLDYRVVAVGSDRDADHVERARRAQLEILILADGQHPVHPEPLVAKESVGIHLERHTKSAGAAPCPPSLQYRLVGGLAKKLHVSQPDFTQHSLKSAGRQLVITLLSLFEALGVGVGILGKGFAEQRCLIRRRSNATRQRLGEDDFRLDVSGKFGHDVPGLLQCLLGFSL